MYRATHCSCIMFPLALLHRIRFCVRIEGKNNRYERGFLAWCQIVAKAVSIDSTPREELYFGSRNDHIIFVDEIFWFFKITIISRLGGQSAALRDRTKHGSTRRPKPSNNQWYSLQQTPLVSQHLPGFLKDFTTTPPCFATSDNKGGFVARNTTDCCR